jgi:pyruvate-formate lyase-activating enzyme
MADEAASATIEDEAKLTAVVTLIAEEVPTIPVVLQPAATTKKARPKLTAEQRQVENKKRAQRHRTLDQRKREATVAEEWQGASEQLQLLETEAKAEAI